jgi:hypothetical protein
MRKSHHCVSESKGPETRVASPLPRAGEDGCFSSRREKETSDQWLTSVILATGEAKIGRTEVPDHPGQKSHETPFQRDVGGG